VPTAEEKVRDIQQAMVEGEPTSIRNLKEELWTSCLDVVSNLAARYTRKSPHLREDFINEGYLKFEQIVPTFDPDRGVPFRGYLCGCVQRHFQDKVRKRTEQLTDSVDDLPAADQDVDAGLRHEEIAARIDEVLNRLLPRDKQRQRKIMAFRLRHLEGWSVEQIRAWLNDEKTSANTISQWIHRVGKAFSVEFPHRYPEYFADLCQGPFLELENHPLPPRAR
jgi:RNA polymerase sigma factor (sigma-70 family)